MPRLRNTKTGAIVSVPDEKVARLGGEWESAEGSAPKAPAKKSAPSKSEK